jgi:hypothetical protein
MDKFISILMAGALLCGCNGEKQNGGDGGPDPWEPPHVYQDVAFEQEMGRVAGSLTDVRAVALDSNDVCHVATAGGVMKWDQGDWQAVTTPIAGEVVDIAFDGSGTLGVAGSSGAAAGSQSITLPAGAVPVFIAPRAAGGWWVGGDDFAGYWDGSYNSIYDSINQPVRDICDLPDGTWFAATPQGVFTATGAVTTTEGLPSDEVRAVEAAPGGTVWAGTDAGMARRDAGAWTAFVGADGLHYGDILDIAFDAEGGMLVSTSQGASRFHPDGSRRYYLGRIWLPDNQVRGMARTRGFRTIWLATAGGVSRVERFMVTLEEKAALFDQITQERHVRLGYTSTENRLEVAGDVTTFSNHDDDNDGQWSAMYLASQCFRYAVTGEDVARENARVTAYALMFLEEVTPIEGFFARSIVPPEECEAKQQSGSGEWHLSDDGAWCWKGDTSSDEFVGHIFGLSIFYDLVANDEEKEDVARTVGRIVGYIVDNGYQLKDIDGEVTSHGQFNPEWMEENPSAMFGDAGLNSAMILGALHAAYRMTGEGRFRESFDYLARKRNYEDYISCIEETNLAWHTNHDSEEMSFLAMYTLMRYEDDPVLLEKWRNGDPELECAGLQYLWDVQRPERNPEFNMIYAPLAQKDEYDLENSIETLKLMPADLILWGLDLNHRWDRDVHPERDRFGNLQNEFVFPYNERQAMRWAENPYAYVLRGDGHSESSGTFWLLPYWMGRYYGVIE